jgi:hypothetical protein
LLKKGDEVIVHKGAASMTDRAAVGIAFAPGWAEGQQPPVLAS